MSALFGGEQAMQKRLVNAIRTMREKQRISQEQLDEICGFGSPMQCRDDQGTKTADFEADSSRMTSCIFAAASFALDLNIDEVLQPDLDGETMQQVIDEMRCQKSGLVACAGTPERQDVILCDQVPVYVILKALCEMDQMVASRT